MSTTKKGGAKAPQLFDLPGLPELPDLGALELPDLPDLPSLDGLGDGPPPNPLDATDVPDDMTMEEAAEADDKVLDDEFAAVRAGREQQRQAVKLANDTEYWFAVYFQSREQKEAFLKAMHWFQHGDKYLDGQWVAKKQGIELPPRVAPYKVGRLDKSLTDLT